MAPVRGKEIALLGADAYVVNGVDPCCLELSAVGRREIEQQPVTRALLQESRIEPRAELRADLVAAAAYARADACANMLASVLVAHDVDRGPCDTCLRPAPARM